MTKNGHKIEVILTDNEYDELMKQKKFLGYSTYAQLIRSYIHASICYRIDCSGFYELATQVSRVGNNINQIAVAVNSSHDITPYQLKMLKKQMNEVEEILRKASEQKADITQRLAEGFFVE
jgi:precorrin-3B methylase